MLGRQEEEVRFESEEDQAVRGCLAGGREERDWQDWPAAAKPAGSLGCCVTPGRAGGAAPRTQPLHASGLLHRPPLKLGWLPNFLQKFKDTRRTKLNRLFR